MLVEYSPTITNGNNIIQVNATTDNCLVPYILENDDNRTIAEWSNVTSIIEDKVFYTNDSSIVEIENRVSSYKYNLPYGYILVKLNHDTLIVTHTENVTFLHGDRALHNFLNGCQALITLLLDQSEVFEDNQENLMNLFYDGFDSAIEAVIELFV